MGLVYACACIQLEQLHLSVVPFLVKFETL